MAFRQVQYILSKVFNTAEDALNINIGSVTPQLDDTDKQAVSLYGESTVAGDTAILASASGGMRVSPYGSDYDQRDGATNTGTQVRSSSGGVARFEAYTPLFNGTTWDRQRNNEEVTLLASAARTAEANSTDQTNYNGSGLIIIVDWTVEADTSTLTPRLQIKDSISNDYFTVWSAAADLTAIGTYAYLFQPGTAAGSYTEAVNLRVGRTWRFQMGVGDADSSTYSVSGVVLV